MLLCLELVIETHNILVIALFQNAKFKLGPYLQIFLTLQSLLDHRFNGDELLT